jgi:hypothetical protein
LARKALQKDDKHYVEPEFDAKHVDDAEHGSIHPSIPPHQDDIDAQHQTADHSSIADADANADAGADTLELENDISSSAKSSVVPSTSHQEADNKVDASHSSQAEAEPSNKEAEEVDDDEEKNSHKAEDSAASAAAGSASVPSQSDPPSQSSQDTEHKTQ